MKQTDYSIRPAERTQLFKCPECGWVDEAPNRFCWRDGHRLVALPRGVCCGHTASPIERYCPRCGKAFPT